MHFIFTFTDHNSNSGKSGWLYSFQDKEFTEFKNKEGHKFKVGDKIKLKINRLTKSCTIEINGIDFGTIFIAEEFANLNFYPGVRLPFKD